MYFNGWENEENERERDLWSRVEWKFGMPYSHWLVLITPLIRWSRSSMYKHAKALTTYVQIGLHKL